MLFIHSFLHSPVHSVTQCAQRGRQTDTEQDTILALGDAPFRRTQVPTRQLTCSLMGAAAEIRPGAREQGRGVEQELRWVGFSVLRRTQVQVEPGGAAEGREGFWEGSSSRTPIHCGSGSTQEATPRPKFDGPPKPPSSEAARLLPARLTVSAGAGPAPARGTLRGHQASRAHSCGDPRGQALGCNRGHPGSVTKSPVPGCHSERFPCAWAHTGATVSSQGSQ